MGIVIIPLAIIGAIILVAALAAISGAAKYKAERRIFIESYMRKNRIHPDYRVLGGFMLKGERYVAIAGPNGWDMVRA